MPHRTIYLICLFLLTLTIGCDHEKDPEGWGGGTSSIPNLSNDGDDNLGTTCEAIYCSGSQCGYRLQRGSEVTEDYGELDVEEDIPIECRDACRERCGTPDEGLQAVAVAMSLRLP